MKPQILRSEFLMSTLILAIALAAMAQADRPKNFVPEPLTECLVSDVKGSKPVFIKRMSEGNVALYGILLQAYRNPQVADYLLKSKVNNLWEYQKGYGVTSEDAAIVIEALLDYGIDRKSFSDSAETLIRDYYQNPGYFITTVHGRAYFAGPSLEITAHIGYLLTRIDAEKYKKQIQASARFVADQQLNDGSWAPLFFPSRELNAYFAIRFLATQGKLYRQQISAAADYLEKHQAADGGWNNSAVDAATAYLALRAAGRSGAAVARAKQYLVQERNSTKQRVEPILHYWFEYEATRDYYACFDRGELAKAWINIALKR